MFLQITIACFLAISLPASASVSPALRGSHASIDTTTAPLDVNLVVESIADFMWHNPNSQFSQHPPSAFVVKGSYPAAIKAFEYNSSFVLPYNDIDIFLPSVTHGDGPCDKRLYSVGYVEGIITGQKIEVNFVEMCEFADSLQDHAEDADINAVSVAFKVVPSKAADRVVPKLDSWATAKDFELFLRTKTLAITKQGFETRPAQSLIRMMKKAQQLNLDYDISLQTPGSLKDVFHGAQFGKNYKRRLDALDEKHSAKFHKAFDVISDKKKNRFTLSVKGEKPPTPAERKLAAACIYDEVEVECFFGVLPAVQLSGEQTYEFSASVPVGTTFIGLLEGDVDTIGSNKKVAGGKPSFTFVPQNPGPYTPFASGATSCHDGAATFHVSLRVCQL